MPGLQLLLVNLVGVARELFLRRTKEAQQRQQFRTIAAFSAIPSCNSDVESFLFSLSFFFFFWSLSVLKHSQLILLLVLFQPLPLFLLVQI